MRLATLAVFGLALSLPAAAAAQERMCAHRPSPTAASPAYEFQYEGLIAGVIYSVRRQAGMDVQITIGLGEKSVDVVVAPMDWLDAQQVVFRSGERVEVLGARADRGTIVAREIHTTDRTLVLRDSRGHPLWK